MSGEPTTLTAEEAKRRTLEAALRFRAAVRVEGVLATIVPGDATLQRLARERNIDGGRFVLLTGLPLDSEEYLALLQSLEQAVTARERALVALDAGITRETFSERFQPGAHDDATLADYSAMLSRSAAVDLHVADRIERLLTRLISRCTDADGTLDRSALRTALEAMLPPSVAAEEVVKPAVALLEGSLQGAATAPNLEALVDSDFFSELHRHRKDLGHTLLAPAVLTASLAVRAAVNHLITRQAAQDAAEEAALRQHLARAETEARERPDPKKQAEAAQAERREQRATPPRAGPAAKGARPPTQQGSPRPRARRQPSVTYNLVVGLLFVAALGVLGARLLSNQSIRELDPVETESFTPLLTDARLVPARDPQVLVGRFNAIAWQKSSPQERHLAAEELATRVAARGLSSATVMVNAAVVVRIEKGRVLMVE